MKKVLFAIPTLRGGGAERVVARLAGQLCQQHEVHIATFARGLEGAYDTDPRITLHELVPARSQFKPYTLAYGFLPISRWRDLHNLKRSLGIDVCASFLTDSNQDNIYSRAGERTVVSIRNTLAPVYELDPLRRMRELIRIKDAAQNADAIVAVTHGAAIEQVEFFGADPSRVSVIHNYVDACDLRAQAQEPLDVEEFKRFREEHDLVVIAAGRRDPQKAHWHLIRAFREVRSQMNVGLVILGAGVEWKYAQLVEANGLSKDVLLPGFSRHVPSYLAQCDLFVSPSLFEGLSNVMLEAMAIGLPIVSTDHPTDAREVLAPSLDPAPAQGPELAEFGVLSPQLSGNQNLCDGPLEPAEHQLAQTLLLMLGSPELRERYGRLAELRVRDFAPEKIVAQWAEVLQVPWEPGA